MSTATTPQIAFLISAHTDPQQLARLIKALPQEARFFVHVDKKANIREFEDAVRGIADVSFTHERYNVMWGSFGQVRYQMALIRQALAEAPDAEYFFSLSGLDYPLWPEWQIRDAVRCAGGRQFLYATPMAMRGDEARLYREYRLLNTLPWRYGTLKSKMRVALRHIIKALGIRKPLVIRSDSGRMYSLYKGGSWWGITRGLATEALNMYDNDKSFTRYFVNAFGPDETFIHTIAMNNPRYASRSTLVRSTRLEDLSPLTYIEYGSEIKTFTEKDLDTLLSSGKMFCRKTVSGISERLIALIGDHWKSLAADRETTATLLATTGTITRRICHRPRGRRATAVPPSRSSCPYTRWSGISGSVLSLCSDRHTRTSSISSVTTALPMAQYLSCAIPWSVSLIVSLMSASYATRRTADWEHRAGILPASSPPRCSPLSTVMMCSLPTLSMSLSLSWSGPRLTVWREHIPNTVEDAIPHLTARTTAPANPTRDVCSVRISSATTSGDGCSVQLSLTVSPTPSFPVLTMPRTTVSQHASPPSPHAL